MPLNLEFDAQARKDRHELIQRTATRIDRELASLLMRAAFSGSTTVEAELGLGPLYLEQAFYINHSSSIRNNIKALLA